jgi:Double-GTPase 2
VAEFLAGVVAIALYLGACWLALVYVVDPTWPYAIVVGAAVGAATVVLLVIGTLLRIGGLGARTVTPADVPARLPAIRSAFPRDDAWPNYLFGQARTDLRAALGHVGHVVGLMWAAMLGVVQGAPFALFAWPLLLLPFAAAVAATLAALVAVVVLGVVLGAVLALARLGWLVAVGVLRGVDLGVRVLRRAKATCTDGACTFRTRLPAYRCTCGRIHHDVRAGRQGLFVRRCACGTKLPTTVLQAAAGLVPLCQNCERDLRAGAGTLTDVVMPVFGSTSAGKTRLIYAGMVALSRHLPAVGGTFTPDGADSEATFRSASTVVEEGTQTTKTAADRPPAAITVRLGTGRRPALLHLFDAAGEAFSSRDQAADLRFLDDPQGMVFVLDPFSMPQVADALRGALASRLAAAEPAFLDPEESYFITVSWLRDQGVALRRKPLAVAVVKADLLFGLPPADGLTHGSSSDDIARWLRGKGLDNLLDGMGRDFREVTFHLVASRDAGLGPDGAAGPTSAAGPLLWLLRHTGVPVPERVAA